VRQKSEPEKQPAEGAIKDIRRRRVDTFRPRRRSASGWKLRGEESIAELCRAARRSREAAPV
jgi:hypothetical protein